MSQLSPAIVRSSWNRCFSHRSVLNQTDMFSIFVIYAKIVDKSMSFQYNKFR